MNAAGGLWLAAEALIKQHTYPERYTSCVLLDQDRFQSAVYLISAQVFEEIDDRLQGTDHKYGLPFFDIPAAGNFGRLKQESCVLDVLETLCSPGRLIMVSVGPSGSIHRQREEEQSGLHLCRQCWKKRQHKI